MKKKIFDNLGLKILAVVFALILWLVVMNVSDYSVTNKINDIPVIQLNGDALEELDQIYDVTNGSTVDIIVKGRRSLVDGLSAKDFEATADLSTMSITNTVQIFVTPKNKNLADEITISCVDNSMSLSLEEKLSVQLPISIKTLGTVKENYAIASTVTAPNLVTIEGPATAVSKVTRAEVGIKVEGKSDNFDTNSEIVLYDAYDEEIKNDKIVISDKSVDVKVEIYPIKEIPVIVETEGEPMDGFLISEVMYQPQSIMVVGAPQILSDIRQIKVDGVSVKGATSNLETMLDVTNYLPEGVAIAQSSRDLAVTIEVERTVSSKLTPSSSDFSLYENDSDYVYEVIPSDDFAVTVTGLDKDVGKMNTSALRLKVNCSKLYYGTNYEVEYEMYEKNGVSYNVTGTIDVRVMTAEEAEREKEDN